MKHILQGLLCGTLAGLLYLRPEPWWFCVPLITVLLVMVIDIGVEIRNAIYLELHKIVGQRLNNLAAGNLMIMATMTRRDLMAAGVPEEKLPEDDLELLEKASELYENHKNT